MPGNRYVTAEDILPTWKNAELGEWDALIRYRGVESKRDTWLVFLADMYDRKLTWLEEDDPVHVCKTDEELAAFITHKGVIREKYACVLKEIELRADGLVNREKEKVLHDTTYYIDPNNGNNASTGQKHDGTCESGTDTDTIVSSDLDGLGLQSGDFVWNETRSAGSYIDTWNDGTDTIELTGTISGQTSGDTFYVISAWKTVEQYSATTSRTPGDIGYIRANTTETLTDKVVYVDDDGQWGNLVNLIGCNSTTNDPWNDDSDVQPVLDGNNSSVYYSFDGSSFWFIDNIKFYNSTFAYGMLYMRGCVGMVMTNLTIDAQVIGIHSYYSCSSLFEDITITDCTYGVCFSNYSNNCTFRRVNIDDCSSYSIYGYAGIDALFDDCEFGVNINSSYTLYFRCVTGQITFKNCVFSDDADIYQYSDGIFQGTVVIEDYNRVLGVHKFWCRGGMIEKDAVITIDSLPSIKMIPDSNNLSCAFPHATDGSIPIITGSHAVKLGAGTHTISIKARETTAWSSDPSATEFYLEASYIPGSSGAARAIAVSDESLSGVSEITFQVEVTLQQTTWVYTRFVLADYESGKSVNVSQQYTVS